MTPTFVPTPKALQSWLKKHHKTSPELLVGFHKKDSGKPSITWPEAVDEALCVGWIDGVRKRIDDHSYQIRFTPRKSTSTWSAVNIKRVAELTAAARMTRHGLRAFENRQEKRSVIYAYEQGTTAKFTPTQDQQFRNNKKAWAFFESLPPWLKRRSIWRVISAKREETQQARLVALIAASARGERW